MTSPADLPVAPSGSTARKRLGALLGRPAGSTAAGAAAMAGDRVSRRGDQWASDRPGRSLQASVDAPRTMVARLSARPQEPGLAHQDSTIVSPRSTSSMPADDRDHDRSVARFVRRLTGRFARRASGGQAVVEMAIILPVFLVLTIGVVDFTRVFTSYIALTNGVREGAIFAADGDGYTKWCRSAGSVACPAGTAASNQAADPLNVAYRIDVEAVGLTKANIVFRKPRCITSGGTESDCTAVSATYKTVRISASYPVPILTPILGNILGGTVTVSASTTAEVLQ